MKHIIFVALFVPSLAMAQQVTQDQLDGAAASVTRTVIGLTNQIAADQQRIVQLQTQIIELQKQIDAVKVSKP